MVNVQVLIKRTGDLISVTSEYGVVVTCNFISELCTVDISPFYFGQVNGMLGTFNNEPSDDFTGKGDVVIRNQEELAQSWMVRLNVIFIDKYHRSFIFSYQCAGFAVWHLCG